MFDRSGSWPGDNGDASGEFVGNIRGENMVGGKNMWEGGGDDGNECAGSSSEAGFEL